jgi:uncharacterized membrane protein
MNRALLQKYALNLGWFILLMGGISLFDRGVWAVAGLLLFVAGIVNLVNTIRVAYLNKKTVLISVGGIFWTNIAGILLIALAQFFVSKKASLWELQLFLVLIAGLLLLAKAYSPVAKAPKTKK